jgi:mannose-6-phosphate isomerase-like protein (cupin superfamily)
LETNVSEKVSISRKLEQIDGYWEPHIVGEVNGQEVRLAKIKGEFVWHRHEDADELFLVLKGSMTIHLRDRSIDLTQGEIYIVPRGVEHRPESEEEAHLLLFEPAGTVNTGNLRNERTVDCPERI